MSDVAKQKEHHPLVDAVERVDRRRDRTCNLLIRSQAPCHWASRPWMKYGPQNSIISLGKKQANQLSGGSRVQ